MADSREIGVSLIPPPKVGKLQAALHTKAKDAPDYRFYALYDKLYRRDILEYAYDRCRANGGAPGVDGQTFADIEAYGVDRWLDELTEELRNGDVPASAGSPGEHPQRWSTGQVPAAGNSLHQGSRGADGGRGLVLEPIFEADLEPEQHAYRPGHDALDAVREVERLLRTGHTEVVDADLSGYFDPAS